MAVVSIAAAFAPAGARAAAGDLYVSAFGPGGNVVRISPDGTVNPFVSNLTGPNGMAFDSKGVLYIAQNNGTIVKIVNGSVVPFASGLTNQSSFGLAFDKFGVLYATESQGGVVTKITADGTKSNYASSLPNPIHLAFDHQGNLFVSIFGASSTAGFIYKYAPTGRTTFASSLHNPEGLAFSAAGNLYEADTASGTINQFTPAGAKTPFASVYGVRSLAFDANGNLYAADNISTISKVTPAGTVSTFKNINSVQGLAVEPPLSQPLNISTRVKVQAGDNALIGGFIATGSAPKKLMVRAIGPSLANFGVPGTLQDTTLEVRAANGSLIGTNDNWKINDQTNQSQQAAIQATGLAPSDDRESALIIDVAPAAFTAIVRGKNNTSGVGLVEIYDLNQAADSRLANISSRAFVETGDNVMIGGFIVGSGNGAAKVVARALGPSLSALGISNALQDPILYLRDANGAVVEFNDDWKLSNHFDSGQEVATAGLAPTNDRESALLVTLPNGNYTVTVSGYNGGTGVGVVEVYNLR
jgi:sugar lactone lactonase YvrE